MRIWLDDIRPAPEGWEWTDNPEWVRMMLKDPRVVVTHLSLDHDLGEGIESGYDLCKWMAENNLWPSEGIAIHSQNPVGRDNMKATINRYSSFVLW